MIIRILAVDQTTGEMHLIGVCEDLTECLASGDEYLDAEAQIAQQGFAMIGGGAAQLFRLEPISREEWSRIYLSPNFKLGA